MKFKKTFEIEYEADDADWMNQYNLALCLEGYAPGGKPYAVREVTRARGEAT